MEGYEHKEWGYVVGLLLGAALCWNIPFWVADWTGYQAELEALVWQSKAWKPWAIFAFNISLMIAGGLIAFASLAITFTVLASVWLILAATGKFLWAQLIIFVDAVAAIITWLARAVATVILNITGLIWEFASWPFRHAFELAADGFAVITENAMRKRNERLQLKAMYRERFTENFRSFRAFRKYWEGMQNYEEPPYPGADSASDSDNGQRQHREQQERKQEQHRQQNNRREKRRDPYEAALALLGLSEPFTKAELGARFKLAMRKAHPDISGDEKMAQRINIARDLIKQRKGWT